MLAAAVLDEPRPQMLRAAFVLEVDLHIPLFPFLEVAHDARPFTPPDDGERPFVIGRIVRFETEHLDAGARRLVHDDPCANHLRIVEHQQLAFGQHVADVGEMRFADLPAAVNQQFRGAALGQRELGDPPVGQVVIEFVYVYMPFIHGHKCTFFSLPLHTLRPIIAHIPYPTGLLGQKSRPVSDRTASPQKLFKAHLYLE